MEEQELDLLQLWEVIKKRWKIIVVFPIIAALLSGIISFFVLDPVYQTSTTLIVGKKVSDDISNQASQLLDYNVLMANKQLAKTYGAIAKSRTVEENVIKSLKLEMTAEQLDKKITVDSVMDTEIIGISVVDKDPNLAADIANAMAKQFTDSVIDIKKVDSVSIIDKAVPIDIPIKPNKSLNILIAFVVGLMAAVGLVFLIEFLDNTIKNEKDVEEILGLPVLGTIPDFYAEKK
ncbi:MAG: Wzz/FepE/Etk N-terminal domain-containing protein [Eubacteriales bacterium]